MKKALLVITLPFLFVVAAHAQITKGSILLGGNLGFGNSENIYSAYYKQSYVSLNPVIGIAVKTNLVAGIGVFYNHGKSSSDSFMVTPQNSTSSGGSFFLRRYLPIAKSFYLYGQGDLGYNHYQYKTVDVNFSQKIINNTVSINVAPGMAYAVSKKFHLEVGLNDLLGISYTKGKIEASGFGGDKTVKGNAFNFNTGLSTATSFYIGFRVFLSK